MNLPSTSRGILENCMNENTENSRIEVERLQSDPENTDWDSNDGNVNKCSSQKACNSKTLNGNANDITNPQNNTIHVSEQNTSCSNKVSVIESSLFTNTVRDFSSAPSCSGVVHNKLCGDNSSIEDDSKRQGRKRRNDCEKDNSSSDDESNKSSKRLVKVLLLDKKNKNPTSNSLPIIPDMRVQVSLHRDDNAQPSTSGCQRNTGTLEEPVERSSTRSRSSIRIEIDGDMIRPEHRSEPGQNSRPETVRGTRSETGRISFQDIPEVHRDASGNPFRVFRINRTIGNAENAR